MHVVTMDRSNRLSVLEENLAETGLLLTPEEVAKPDALA